MSMSLISMDSRTKKLISGLNLYLMTESSKNHHSKNTSTLNLMKGGLKNNEKNII